MKTKKVGPLPVGDDLEVTVRNLIRRLQTGSRVILVTVCDARLVGLKQATVMGVGVEFVMPGDGNNLDDGHLMLTYAYDETNSPSDLVEDGRLALPTFSEEDTRAFIQDMDRK